MQIDDNRLTRKSYILAPLSENQSLTLAKQAVENALILSPKMRIAQLAEQLIAESDPELASKLSTILTRHFYISQIRKVRLREAMARRAQLLLPGFEHLPLKIPNAKGGLLDLLDANLFRVRDYYRSLTRTHEQRQKNDPKIREAKALMAKMQKRSRTELGITVRQVLALEEQ